MGILKSKRKPSIVGYIRDAYEARLLTMKIVKTFPVSYRYILTNNILNLVTSLFTNCTKAESISLERATRYDIESKYKYLADAKSDADSLLAEITFAYELVNDGNNFFKNKEDYGKKFQAWAEKVCNCLDNIERNIDVMKEKHFKKQKEYKKIKKA